MAFVYKPVVTSKTKGEKRRRRSRYYWASYMDESGQEVRRPLRLPNGTKIKNRLLKSAMSEQLGDKKLNPTKGLATLYRTWAKGGIGLQVTGNVMIDRTALGEPRNVALDMESDLCLFEDWAKAAGLTHTLEPSAGAPDTASPAGAAPAGGAIFSNTGTEPLAPMSSDAVESTGAGAPMENRQPFLDMNFIIALVGTYPSRS